MARELKNVEVQFVSYVDKAANKKKFFLLKSDKEPNFEKEVRILTKGDDPKKLVYGIVYAPDEVDSQGDFMSIDEIEKAAHSFMKNFQQIDEQHNFTEGAGTLVESTCQLADIEVGDEIITKGTWTIVTEATDDIWDKIEKGEYTGYSLAGVAGKLANKKEKKFDDVILKYANRSMEVILKDFDSSMEDMKNNDLYLPMDVLYKSIWDARWEFEDSSDFKKAAKKVVNQFMKHINGMTFEPIKKGEEPENKKGEESMLEKQEVQAMIDKSLEPITKSLGLEDGQTIADVITKAIGEIKPPESPVVKNDDGEEVSVVDTLTKMSETFKVFKEEVSTYMTENKEKPLEPVEEAKPIEKSDSQKKSDLAL